MQWRSESKTQEKILLRLIYERLIKVDKTLDDLKAQADANNALIEQALTALAAIQASNGDPAKIQAIFDELAGEDTKLGAALAQTAPPASTGPTTGGGDTGSGDTDDTGDSSST